MYIYYVQEEISKLEKEIEKLSVSIKQMERQIIRLEFDSDKLSGSMAPILDSIQKIRDSILGVAGEKEKIGLSGELRIITTKLENFESSIEELKANQKEQANFNLQTVAKTSIIPIILIILIEVGKHFISVK